MKKFGIVALLALVVMSFSIFPAGYKVGDKAITKSGIHGKIAELSDDTIVVETMAGKIKMEKSAISSELSAKLAAK